MGHSCNPFRKGWITIIKFVGKMSKLLERIASAITITFMIFLTFLIFFSVLLRYAFNSPVEIQYETTLVCLSWVVFIGMSLTFKAKEQMSLTFVVNALKPKLRVVWLDAIDILLIIFLILGIYESISITVSTWSTMYQTIPVSRGLFYLAFPIGASFSVVHLLHHIMTRRSSEFTDNVEKEI